MMDLFSYAKKQAPVQEPEPEDQPENDQEEEQDEGFEDYEGEENYLKVWACGPGKKKVLCHSITWPHGEPMPRRTAT
ncbi:hypothetical protein LCGC14_1938920 [marine sediment metagenome]|uniref:Uncharacterized protein n=1 Tax=marine sediment metagenome TaxID=412755 RepID=A0A0F9FKU0_9ZZZZ